MTGGQMADHDNREAHAQLIAAVIEGLPRPTIVLGADQRVVAANGEARLAFPGLRTQVPLFHVMRATDVWDAAKRAALTASREMVVLRERVPVERVFEVTVASLPALSEWSGHVMLSFEDQTELRRLEQMRTDFVANASHELRTPLSSLLGFIETLQGAAKSDGAARDRFLVIMRQQAQRMARLIDDLLSLSRIEQSLHLNPSEPVNLAEVVGHIADALAPLARVSGAEIKIVALEDAIVAGERDELVRVVENLIENAIKYGTMLESGVPSRIEVSVVATPREAVLRVRDFGPGIPTRHLPRLTERFYRIDAEDSRAKGGTGLGLAIVKHIVARHRGRLSIESSVGLGAIFIVSLPSFAGTKNN